jgi:hypothetical protein
VMSRHALFFSWVEFSGCSHEVVDGEVSQLRCVDCDDSPVIKVHTFVTKFDCQECVGSP